MERFRKGFCLVITCFLIFCSFFSNATITYADSKMSENNDGELIKRSLESMQDVNSQTWQIIVYPSSKISNNLTLRIVGYPGSLRVDHPTNLQVNSGRKSWYLSDITKKNRVKAETMDDSTAEFNLSPLIADLDKNRPLRISLPGLIKDLPIPPYLVAEWRSLAVQK